jgi:hypothetical protein
MKIRKSHALIRHAIEIWRLISLRSEWTNISVPHIIAKDDDDVRFIFRPEKR